MKRLPPQGVMALNFRQNISSRRIGNIVDINEQGKVIVDYPGKTLGLVSAKFTRSMMSTLSNSPQMDGQKVLLLFDSNDPKLLIIWDTFHDENPKRSEDERINLKIEKVQKAFLYGKKILSMPKRKLCFGAERPASL